MATATDLKTTLMVGMEVHVELCTRSKMWTAAPNVAHPDYHDAAPNTLTDPVVLGLPGTLPVINKAAVEMSIKVGLALGCRIPGFTKWDRKSYYYPDLPKNYQISQYDQPLCEQGTLEIPTSDEADAPLKTVRIIRAHLEEDAGKLLHEAPGGRPIEHSIVDLNRAGTPLLEIVTEPDLCTPDECVMFARTLRNICRSLGVTRGIMQKGHIRFEPNINVIIERDGNIYKTPIVEIKNLNSFKAVHGAVSHEYKRQVKEWLTTGNVMGERAKTTRGWDDSRNITTLQRAKEDADEYRYFPDPDLVPILIDDAWKNRIASEIGELPLARARRYTEKLGLTSVQTRTLIDEPAVCTFFEQTLETGADPKRAATLLCNIGQKRANEQNTTLDKLGATPQQIAGIVTLLDANQIGSSAIEKLLELCCEHDDTAQTLAKTHGLLQICDTAALEGYIDQVLADPENEKALADLRDGKDKAVGALMGQIMKLSQGKANAKIVRDLILEKVRST